MKNKAKYGLDAPAIVKKNSIIGSFCLAVIITGSHFFPTHWISSLTITLAYTGAFYFLSPAFTICLGSFIFKFKDRDWLLHNLNLKGHEKVLDVGCGHGLLLIGAAKHLKTGKAIGIDLWVQDDQASNTKEATLENAKIEGVYDKIEIQSGDMRNLPFENNSFDAIVSSWAIHNIYDKIEREKALSEIIRVLKPGGKIAILDIDHAKEYKAFFEVSNLKLVDLKGPHFTFGNKTYLVLAQK